VFTMIFDGFRLMLVSYFELISNKCSTSLTLSSDQRIPIKYSLATFILESWRLKKNERTEGFLIKQASMFDQHLKIIVGPI
jgi:hypothetical protein